jgi:Putative transposase/Transposase zinc-binding domain
MEVSNNYLLQNTFQSYAPQLQKQSLPLHHIKAIEAITHCRSGAYGTSYYRCSAGHEYHQQQHSCRHRSCYLCSRGAQHQWVEAQKHRLLNCPHFHVIFTLPSEYRVLWQYNQAWFTQALFQTVQEVLLSLMSDPRHHGVLPGLLLTLHTWGRQLNLHPHIHALITAGGLDTEGEWNPSGEYLLPIRLLKSLYRDKLQCLLREALSMGELQLPPDMELSGFYQLHRAAYEKTWSIRVEEQYQQGKGVVIYLSRYMKGGPLHPSQIIRCDAEGIGFMYKDHRDKKRKLLTLKPMVFLRRLLQHTPVPGIHTVRHYGLYASACRDKRNLCRQQMGDQTGIEGETGCKKEEMLMSCRTCGSAMRLSHRTGRSWNQKGNSLIKHVAKNIVQQVDETDIASIPQARAPCSLSG